MAKRSQWLRWQKTKRFKTREYNRCQLCGRSGGYLRRFGLCRICFRTYALRGMVPGVRKSSW
jgi:small subunit ribosomal protein S14